MDALRISATALCLALVAAAPADPLDHAVTKLMSVAHIPGMQVLVIDNGRVTASRSYGVKDVATKAPVDAHTRFEIGSITKQFTAAAILQLKERGKLKLTDALATYVPNYAAAKHVTIAQLLGMVSGIPNYTDSPAFKALRVTKGGTVTIRQRGDVTRVIALVKDKPLDFPPGTRGEYSNTNYALLGRIVEIASGMPWAAYVRANIFRPAGMNESAFMDDEGTMADVATGYRTKKKGSLARAGTMNGWGDGAGAIVSTAGDLAKWDAALIGGKLISADDLATMLRPGTLPGSGPNSHYGYGYGWNVDAYEGQSRVWHNGESLGFHATNQIYRSLSETIVVLANKRNSDTDAVANAVFKVLHPALAAAAAKPAAGEDPKVTARLKRVWNAFLSGRPDRSELSARLNAELTPAVLAQLSKQFNDMGVPTAWTFAGRTVTGGTTSYDYRVEFSIETTLLTMSVGPDGKITDLTLH
jgi:CubicO group peptidase (beta-lactamase class C family)